MRMRDLRRRAKAWVCEKTGSLCQDVPKPNAWLPVPACDCSPCTMWHQLMVEGVRPYWTQPQLDKCKQEGYELWLKINQMPEEKEL